MGWNPHHSDTRAPTTWEYNEIFRPQLIIPIAPRQDNDLRLDFYMANEDEVDPDADLQRMLQENEEDSYMGWDQEMLDHQQDKIENYNPSVSTIPEFRLMSALADIEEYIIKEIFTDSKGDVGESHLPNREDLLKEIESEWQYVYRRHEAMAGFRRQSPNVPEMVDFIEEMNGGAMLGEERWDMVFLAMEQGINKYVSTRSDYELSDWPSDVIFSFRYPSIIEPERLIINRTMDTPKLIMTDTPGKFLEDVNEQVMDLFARRGIFPDEIPIDFTYKRGVIG